MTRRDQAARSATGTTGLTPRQSTSVAIWPLRLSKKRSPPQWLGKARSSKTGRSLSDRHGVDLREVTEKVESSRSTQHLGMERLL